MHLNPTGVILNGFRNVRDTDLNRLTRLKTLSWLSSPELGQLAGSLIYFDFKPAQIILRQTELAPEVEILVKGGARAVLLPEAHILVKGIARITCQSVLGEWITMALLPPGLIPQFPSLPLSRFDFRCEAYNDCRIGNIGWDQFNRIAVLHPETPVNRYHENDLQQWYRLLLRNSSFLKLGLHERIALALLELSTEFGIVESRGSLLSTAFSHQDIAELVGASRPRVTEHLAEFERMHQIIRQGRQLIICVDEINRDQSRRGADSKK